MVSSIAKTAVAWSAVRQSEVSARSTRLFAKAADFASSERVFASSSAFRRVRQARSARWPGVSWVSSSASDAATGSIWRICLLIGRMFSSS